MAEQIHPAVQELLRFFDYEHLSSPVLREISKGFHGLAWKVAQDPATDGPQLRDGLFDLLRAKDCIVRSALPKPASKEAAS